MTITKVLPDQWPRVRKAVLSFVAKYRDKHITRETNAKLRSLRKAGLSRQGSLLIIASEGKTIYGVLAAEDYGRGFSLAVVRRTERGKGVGKQMLKAALEELDDFYVEIASDNIPSLKIAFACGLRAYSVFQRDNGKVVLRLKPLDVKVDAITSVSPLNL